jgi:hypothetical protein
MTSLSDLDGRSSTILSAEVGLAPPDRVDAVAHDPSAAPVGAALAIAICLVIAAVGWLVTPVGWIPGLVGLPATAFLAWRLGPGVVAATGRRAVSRAGLLAVGTIVLTDALVVIVSVVGVVVSSFDSVSNDGGATFVTVLVGGFVDGVFAFLIGAVLVGIPVAVVVVPAALVWVALVRYLVRGPG